MIGKRHCVACPDLYVGGEAGFSPVLLSSFSCVLPLSSHVFLVRKGQARGRGQAGWQELGNRPNVLCNNFTHSFRHTHTHTALEHTAVSLCFSKTHMHMPKCDFIWVSNMTKAGFLLDLSSCPLVVFCCISVV